MWENVPTNNTASSLITPGKIDFDSAWQEAILIFKHS